MSDQITYKDGVLKVCNPSAPLVSSFMISLPRKEAKKLIKQIYSEVSGNKCILTTQRNQKEMYTYFSVDDLTEQGFRKVFNNDTKSIYIGKMPEDKLDIIIIYEVMDNRFVRQVYLSPRIHMRNSNVEYLEEVIKLL